VTIPTAEHGVWTLPHAVAAAMASAQAVRRDESAKLAQRVQAGRDLEAAWEHARVLFEDLAAVRRRARAILN
jgi:hypothetical protein